MANNPGKSATFQYRHWAGTLWTARLQNVSTQISGPLGVKTTIDPDFHHVPAPGQAGTVEHDDAWLQYLTSDGVHWACKCHSHTGDGNVVSFTFEHFRAPDMDNADHESSDLNFQAWDGSSWYATCPNVGPIPDGQSVAVLFNLSKDAKFLAKDAKA